MRQELKEKIKALEFLPVAPYVAKKILDIDLTTRRGEYELLRLAELSPQISAKILSSANKNRNAKESDVTTFFESVDMVGLHGVKSLATQIANHKPLVESKSRVTPHNIWLHSVTIAVTMQAIATKMPREIRPKVDLIYLAGLLHDVGYTILQVVDPALSYHLHNELILKNSKEDVLAIERRVTGTTHAEIGMLLASSWRLPQTIQQVILHHHKTPESHLPSETKMLINLALLAEKLLPNFGLNETTLHSEEDIVQMDYDALGIGSKDSKDIPYIANETALQVAYLVQ